MVHTHAWKVDRLEHILDLSNRGEYLDEETWDLEGVASATRWMVRKYNIPWDPECVIPSNLNLSGSILQAGIELADQLVFFSELNYQVKMSCKTINFGNERADNQWITNINPFQMPSTPGIRKPECRKP